MGRDCAETNEAPSSSNSSASGDNANKAIGGGAAMPKHMSFPEFGDSSELLNELIMFFFITCAAAMQFINIYRANWWLPESHINHAVNFYLVDRYLLVLIFLITARRLVFCLLLRALDLMQRRKQQRIYRNILNYGFGGTILALLGFCVIKIYTRNNTYFSIFVLVYPLIVYLLIFGFRIEPFLRSSCEADAAYFNNMPMHCCSTSAMFIRSEIEVLRNDFNRRFKQVIFTSVVNAYYAGFVPCFFAVSVYYNVMWATQHIVFVWLSGFTMCTIFGFPSKYSDILHRASLHLGHWCRVELRPGVGGALVAVSAAAWNKSVMWANNTIVKHGGEVFRCLGPATAAQPGDSSHSRFYKLFHNPSLIYLTLTTVQSTIMLTQIILLYYAVEWHFIMSIAFLALTNQFTFFKIMRDYLITKRVYNAENSITNKSSKKQHSN